MTSSDKEVITQFINQENITEYTTNSEKSSISTSRILQFAQIAYKYAPDINLPLSYQIPSMSKRIIFSLLILLSFSSISDEGITPQYKTLILSQSEQTEHICLISNYLGRLLGCLCFFLLIKLIPEKILLLGMIAIKFLSLLFSIFTSNYYFFIVCRGFSGFSMEFIQIFIPVWCELYGRFNKKVMMIAVAQMSFSLGPCIGLFGIFIFNKFYMHILFLELICLAVLAAMFSFYPNEYFFVTVDRIDIANNVKYLIKDKFKSFKIIFSELSFTCTCVILSINFFTINIIQVWGWNYIKSSFSLNENTGFFIFSFTIITGPLLGVFFGGIVSSFLGGYQTFKSYIFCIIFTSLAFLSQISIGFIHNVVVFFLSAWLFSIFIGLTLPIKSGIIISYPPISNKFEAFSISHLLIILIGNFPSYFIYSNLKFYYSENVAMRLCTKIVLVNIVFIVIKGILINKRIKKNQKESDSSNSSSDDMVLVDSNSFIEGSLHYTNY